MEKQLEAYLGTTLAGIGDAVLSTDTEGRVVFVNSVALSVLRAAEADVKGKPIDEVFRIQDELTGERIASPLRKVLDAGSTVGSSNHTVLMVHDGTEIPIENSAAPIRGDDGKLQGVLVVFRDVT